MATTWRYGGFCACGCGQRTNRASRDHKALGWKKDEPYEYIRQHQNNVKKSTYDVDPKTGCWIWRGQRSQPYPKVKVNYKPRGVHLLAWEKANGPVPKGMVLHHRCGKTRCCNVEHLEIVTPATNSQYSRHTKLSMQSAEQIRCLSAAGGYTHRKLAEMYGVSETSIQNVIYGHTWQPTESHRPHSRG